MHRFFASAALAIAGFATGAVMAATDPQCPCTIWPATAVPQVAADSDTGSVNLGVKFTSDVDGYIAGIRFYKGVGNGGRHVGSLWSSSGELLARATFAGETKKGWQSVTFTQPVAITSGASYTASYLAPKGRYAVDQGYFRSEFASGHLLALAGVYRYGTTSAFPSSEWEASNYWVDVSFNVQQVDTAATLTWTAPSDPAVVGYRVYYGTSSGVYLQAKGSGVSAGNATTFTVRDLQPGSKYFFAVTSVNGSNAESVYSNEATKQLR